MRALSFLLALGFLIAGSSLAGSIESDLPGVGTFSYSGAPITTAAPQPIVVATRL